MEFYWIFRYIFCFIFGIFSEFPGNPRIFQSHEIFISDFLKNPKGFFLIGLGFFR